MKKYRFLSKLYTGRQSVEYCIKKYCYMKNMVVELISNYDGVWFEKKEEITTCNLKNSMI